MSSYLKLYEDFLQKKDNSIKASSLPEEEDGAVEEQTSSLDSLTGLKSGTPVSANSSVSNLNSSGGGGSGSGNKMEHSYTRDKTRPLGELSTGLTPARNIMVRKPPQCVTCHTHSIEEHDLEDANQAQIPAYNEIAAKESMNECGRIAKYVKNTNPDDDDWELKVDQALWSNMQKTLFAKIVRILDNDQLGRLANAGRQNEAMQRRVVVDKSASRMRKALASIAWDTRLTQWLHGLLLDTLPSTYMASYLDILQTLKSKLPTLMDKMLFSRPINVSQELLAPVMKKQWEPVIVNTKTRKLAQNAVIVALPSMPTSGPVPKRLQKWYQHLASITQIVQITLPMSSGHIARQPLEQVAEQIVSLTRVKIQDLRNEDSTRSIILIGFNAGAALALQVAMSENIACVVCMGFAYNTFNGARGSPDDRILDIKVPILFVIGQNSARTSVEEIESLRERMQSETSLVIVGSADDVLRVPKSRRKIENVTQAMVDTMVVDELYDFVKRILNNPPGPRIPTAITNAIYNKPNKNVAGGTNASTVQQRKRKLDGTTDNEQTPAKTKYVPHIGRPRTRPLPTTPITAATVKSGSTQIVTSTPVSGKILQKTHISPNSITNEDLNMAIQSILSDTGEPQDAQTSKIGGTGATSKIITNYELMAQPKVMPIKTTLINPLHKTTTIASGGTNVGGTKIKMIPANQFVHIKPPLQSQSKIYTIKTTSMMNQQQQSSTGIGSIVTSSTSAATTGQQQIFTLKSPNGQTTQFVTAAPATAQQKYTVVKNASGGTTLTLTTPKTASGSGNATQMDLSNIIDMPIVFADGEGNISDGVATSSGDSVKTHLGTNAKPGTSSNVGQLIISQKIIKDGNSTSISTPGKSSYVIGKPGTILQTVGSQSQQLGKPSKVVFINRNTMKPCPNIISRSNVAHQLPKYTKVVVTNPKTSATTLVSRAATITPVSGIGSPIVSTVKQVNLQALNAGSPSGISVVTSSAGNVIGRQSGIINMANKSFQIINAGTGGSAATGDKPQIRNIVVKPGGLKQIPAHLKSQLLNRNLTVRKLVNIVPTTLSSGAGSITITPAGGITSDSEAITSTTTSPTSIQTVPKIITLNPINRSVAASGNTGSGVTSSKTD